MQYTTVFAFSQQQKKTVSGETGDGLIHMKNYFLAASFFSSQSLPVTKRSTM